MFWRNLDLIISKYSEQESVFYHIHMSKNGMVWDHVPPPLLKRNQTSAPCSKVYTGTDHGCSLCLKTITSNSMSAVALFSTQNITFIWSVSNLWLKLQRNRHMSGPPLVLYISYRISKIWWSLSDIYSIRCSSNRRRSGRCPAPDCPVDMTQIHRSRLHVFSSAFAQHIPRDFWYIFVNWKNHQHSPYGCSACLFSSYIPEEQRSVYMPFLNSWLRP